MESGRRNRQPSHDPRTDARERALHVLYEARAKSTSGRSVIDAQVLPVDEMTSDIVGGVDDNVEEIDSMISNHAVGCGKTDGRGIVLWRRIIERLIDRLRQGLRIEH